MSQKDFSLYVFIISTFTCLRDDPYVLVPLITTHICHSHNALIKLSQSSNNKIIIIIHIINIYKIQTSLEHMLQTPYQNRFYHRVSSSKQCNSKYVCMQPNLYIPHVSLDNRH